MYCKRRAPGKFVLQATHASGNEATFALVQTLSVPQRRHCGTERVWLARLLLQCVGFFSDRFTIWFSSPAYNEVIFSPPRAQISRAEKTNGGVAETDSQTMSLALNEVGEASIHEPFTRFGACSFVRGEQFYLFRGHYNLSSLRRTQNSLEVLDLRTGLWSSLSTLGSIPRFTYGACCTLINNLLYTFGGDCWFP